MKKILIPLAAAAAFSLSPAYAAEGALGLGKDKTATTPAAAGVSAGKDGAARELNTPVGKITTQANGEAAGVSANLGTAKSPRVKAKAAVTRGNKDDGRPPAAAVGAAVTGPDTSDSDSSTSDRAKNAGDKLTPESAK